MQGFEMLLYGTNNTLYDASSKKWIAGSQGFTDSLSFVKDVYAQGLGPSVQNALDPNFGNVVGGQLLPQSKLGFAVESVLQTDLLEKEWPAADGVDAADATAVQLHARPFQVITLRVRRSDAA